MHVHLGERACLRVPLLLVRVCVCPCCLCAPAACACVLVPLLLVLMCVCAQLNGGSLGSLSCYSAQVFVDHVCMN